MSFITIYIYLFMFHCDRRRKEENTKKIVQLLIIIMFDIILIAFLSQSVSQLYLSVFVSILYYCNKGEKKNVFKIYIF